MGSGQGGQASVAPSLEASALPLKFGVHLPAGGRVNQEEVRRLNEILIGKGEQLVYLLAKYGNRHGLVSGATGTGKTISLIVLAD